jgi:hypothetical protein
MGRVCMLARRRTLYWLCKVFYQHSNPGCHAQCSSDGVLMQPISTGQPVHGPSRSGMRAACRV